MPFDINNVVNNFDSLMTSVDAKIKREYEDQRITGPDYATVYLGAMQSAMQTALGYETQGQTAEAEIALLNQKTLTEEAQIKDTLSDGTVVYTPTVSSPGETDYVPASGGGVLGKQEVLFNKQTDGFDRDAEQKLAKVMNDLYSVAMTTASTPPSIPLQNNDISINKVIEKAKKSLGVSTDTV